MSILTTNERVKRLEKDGLQLLRCRQVAKAEEAFRDQIAALKDFRYVDDLSLTIAYNNLALLSNYRIRFVKPRLFAKIFRSTQSII